MIKNFEDNAIFKYCNCNTIKIAGAKKFIRSRFFPLNLNINFSDIDCYKNTMILGLGGNIGNTKKIFDNFIFMLSKNPNFKVKKSSPILINKAFGYTKQNDFLNSVIILKTSLSARASLKIFQNYEKKFKRKREFKNSPRTLDIDILYYDKKNRNDKYLTLPHPGVDRRISVFLPLGIII